MATEYRLSYTAAQINSKLGEIENLAKKSEIPSKISDLVNDAGYLTEHQSLEGLASETYVDNKISSIPTPDVSGQINMHNENKNAHGEQKGQGSCTITASLPKNFADYNMTKYDKHRENG